MNDNNFRDIIGARLEEIHKAETMPETMPSEADILRWETLAKARTADRKRKMRRFISIAAVFLLAVVIGVAVIVGPPDAEAGGEGNAVIVDGGDGVVVSEHNSFKAVPKKLLEQFILIEHKKYGLEVKTIRHTKGKNTEQLEITYRNDICGEIGIIETISEDTMALQNDFSYYDRKEKWGNNIVYIAENPNDKRESTYMYVCNDVYVLIYVKGNAKLVQDIIEEQF